MAFVITNGYLVNRSDYLTFDEIITFINEHGNLFTNLALGTKKILSKNSRNMFYGCLSEFEFFCSKDIENRIGKLKKITLLENNIINSDRIPLIIFNKIIFNYKLKGKKIFLKLKNLIENLFKYNSSFDNVLIINLLLFIIEELGSKFTVDKCVFCENKKIFSLSFLNNGFVCKIHFNSKRDIKYFRQIIEIFYFCEKQNFLQTKKYEEIFKKSCIKILKKYLLENLGVNLLSIF